MKLSPVPPGPKGHFLVGSLPEIQRDELDFLMRQVHEHGDVVHVRVVNHHAYILSHPRDIETVLVSKSSNFIKSVFLRESKALFGDGLLTSDGSLWQKQRRALATGISSRSRPVLHANHGRIDGADAGHLAGRRRARRAPGHDAPDHGDCRQGSVRGRNQLRRRAGLRSLRPFLQAV